jgi:hypothetical protein
MVQALERACIACGPRITPQITEPFEITGTPVSQYIESGTRSPTLALQENKTNLVPITILTPFNLGQLPIMLEE